MLNRNPSRSITAVRRLARPAAAAAFVCATSFSTTAHGQAADAIIDKLVEKGILTVQEANDLRDEADKGFNSAYQVKSGLPDWVNTFKISGDFRGRFDGIYTDANSFVDRNRFRYRLRLGMVAVMKDDFELGLRLTSAEQQGAFGGDPISGNTSFGANGAKKFVFLDQAYGKWSPLNGPDWTGAFTFGKMENPFVFSDIVFDPDYTPEGGAAQIGYNIDAKHSIKWNTGGFTLAELSASSNDAYLLGTQLRLESSWTPKIATSIGVAGLALSGDEGLATTPAAPFGGGVPNINRGNTRTPIAGTPATGGALVNEYNPIVADAAVTYILESFPFYTGAFPIRVGGEFVHNPGAAEKNTGYQGGVQFGRSGRKGTWEVGYRYKVLEADSWYEELVDSDFGSYYGAGPVGSGAGAGYGPGTNLRGHVVRAAYSPYDSFTLGITYYLANVIDELPSDAQSELTRIQVDAIWKF